MRGSAGVSAVSMRAGNLTDPDQHVAFLSPNKHPSAQLTLVGTISCWNALAAVRSLSRGWRVLSATQHALLFALPVAFFEGGAFIVGLLAFGECNLDFRATAFPVHG